MYGICVHYVAVYFFINFVKMHGWNRNLWDLLVISIPDFLPFPLLTTHFSFPFLVLYPNHSFLKNNPNETVRKTQIEKNLRESEKERETQVQRFSRNIPPNKMVRFFPLSNMILVTLFTFSFSFFGFVTYYAGRNWIVDPIYMF